MQQLAGWDMIQPFNQVWGKKKKKGRENIFLPQTGGLALTYKHRIRINPGGVVTGYKVRPPSPPHISPYTLWNVCLKEVLKIMLKNSHFIKSVIGEKKT